MPLKTAFKTLCETQADTPAQPALSHVETVSRFISEAQRNGAVVTELESLEQVQHWLEREADSTWVMGRDVRGAR